MNLADKEIENAAKFSPLLGSRGDAVLNPYLPYPVRIDQITTETAEKNGLHVDIQPEEYTIPALAAAIETYFRED
jgi:uroporphyrinogen-III synthase